MTRRQYYTLSAMTQPDPQEHLKRWRERIIRAGFNGPAFDLWLDEQMTEEDVKNFEEIGGKSWDEILEMRAKIEAELSERN